MSAKAIIISSIIFIGLIVGMAFLFTSGQKPEVKAISYSQSDTDRPKAEVGNKFTDIGSMGVNDEKTADFSLKNTGTRPLQILDVTTSCHCTFGQIIYKGTESQKFSMNGSGFVSEIAPGDTATVRITYIPSIMPVSGIIEREAYVKTNDPENPRIIFSIQANVK